MLYTMAAQANTRRNHKTETNLHSLFRDDGLKQLLIPSTSTVLPFYFKNYPSKVHGCQTASRDAEDTPIAILMSSTMANDFFSST